MYNTRTNFNTDIDICKKKPQTPDTDRQTDKQIDKEIDKQINMDR